jgi:hypothetical protein
MKTYDPEGFGLCSIDPISLILGGIGLAAGAAAGGVFSGGGGDGGVRPTQPAAAKPAQQPVGSKPSQTKTQPSFLAGASMLPQAQGAGGAGSGKTLLGQ